MTDQTLRRLIGAMATLLVVVVAAGAFVMLSRGGSGSPSPSPSGSTAFASARPSPTTTPSAAVSASASAPTSPSTEPSATPSASGVPAATLTVVGLQLDATTDTAGMDRVITFTSDGPGRMSVKLTTATTGTTHMCFLAGTKSLGCKDWKSGTFNGTTTQAHTTWKVTVRGRAGATPVVNVMTTFQAAAPTVTIENARFDGTAAERTNGIKVRFVPRTDGDARLVAEWGGHPFTYAISMFNQTAGTTGPEFTDQGPSTGVDQAIPVTGADTWQLILTNAEEGFGTTPMTASVSWP